jgi:hypothetical protein
MKHLLNKQGMGNGSTPTKLFCDNQSNIKLVKNLVMHAMTMHIETEHHYIIERTQVSDLATYIPTR